MRGAQIEAANGKLRRKIRRERKETWLFDNLDGMRARATGAPMRLILRSIAQQAARAWPHAGGKNVTALTFTLTFRRYPVPEERSRQCGISVHNRTVEQ